MMQEKKFRTLSHENESANRYLKPNTSIST